MKFSIKFQNIVISSIIQVQSTQASPSRNKQIRPCIATSHRCVSKRATHKKWLRCRLSRSTIITKGIELIISSYTKTISSVCKSKLCIRRPHAVKRDIRFSKQSIRCHIIQVIRSIRRLSTDKQVVNLSVINDDESALSATIESRRSTHMRDTRISKASVSDISRNIVNAKLIHIVTNKERLIRTYSSDAREGIALIVLSNCLYQNEINFGSRVLIGIHLYNRTIHFFVGNVKFVASIQIHTLDERGIQSSQLSYCR